MDHLPDSSFWLMALAALHPHPPPFAELIKVKTRSCKIRSSRKMISTTCTDKKLQVFRNCMVVAINVCCRRFQPTSRFCPTCGQKVVWAANQHLAWLDRPVAKHILSVDYCIHTIVHECRFGYVHAYIRLHASWYLHVTWYCKIKYGKHPKSQISFAEALEPRCAQHGQDRSGRTVAQVLGIRKIICKWWMIHDFSSFPCITSSFWTISNFELSLVSMLGLVTEFVLEQHVSAVRETWRWLNGWTIYCFGVLAMSQMPHPLGWKLHMPPGAVGTSHPKPGAGAAKFWTEMYSTKEMLTCFRWSKYQSFPCFSMYKPPISRFIQEMDFGYFIYDPVLICYDLWSHSFRFLWEKLAGTSDLETGSWPPQIWSRDPRHESVACLSWTLPNDANESMNSRGVTVDN